MKTDGIQLISEERKRQITVEGLSPEWDQKKNFDGELVAAAVCYAMPDHWRTYRDFIQAKSKVVRLPWWWPWTWGAGWWKPSPNDRIRELTKAGALIAAEIDRLLAEGGVSGDEEKQKS